MTLENGMCDFHYLHDLNSKAPYLHEQILCGNFYFFHIKANTPAFKKSICHTKIAQFFSPTRVNKNCHMQNCHIKIARVERA